MSSSRAEEATPPVDGTVWALADLATPMAVRVAATFSVADHLAAGRTTAAAIAEREQLNVDVLDRVLRHLVTVGILYRTGDTYGLTNLGVQLRSDHSLGMRQLIDLDGSLGRGDLSFIELPAMVRSGRPAFEIRYGATFWDDLASDPSLAASFSRAMAHNVGQDAGAIATALDWSAVSWLVDVGGGSAVLLSAILAAHPTLRGTVFDLPGVEESARQTLERNGVSDRSDVQTGDFLTGLPAGAGGYVLSSVLHDWNDEQAIELLARCRQAAGVSGRVFVIEETGDGGESPSTEMDLRMLAYYGGKERSVSELVALGRAAGLQVKAVHAAPGRVASRSVIEFAAPA